MRSYSCCDSNTKTSKDIQALSSLLKLVGEETRLRLLCILKDGGEHCVCELTEHANDLSQSLISHHLSDLKTAGVVESKKIGLRTYYNLTEEGNSVVKTILSLTNKEQGIKEQRAKDLCGPAETAVVDDRTAATAVEGQKSCEPGNCS